MAHIAESDFTSNTVQGAPLPAGKYLAQAIGSEIRRTKAGDGEYAAFTFSILDGACVGRKIFSNFNLVNKNPTAAQIGRDQLKTFAKFARHPNPDHIGDTEELHGRPVLLTVVVKEASGGFAESNEIKGYNYAPAGAAPNGSAPAAVGAAAAPAGAWGGSDDNIPPF